MAFFSSINSPYIVLSSVVLASVVAVFALVRPQVASISKLSDAIVAQTATLQEQQEFLRTTDRKIADLQLQQDQEQRLGVMLPAAQRIEDALRIIHQSGQVAGLILDTVTNASGVVQTQLNAQRARAEAVSIPPDIVPLAMTIDFHGSYQQLRIFLSELERSPRLMDVTDVTVRRSTQTPDQISGSIAVTFYMQPGDTLTEL